MLAGKGIGAAIPRQIERELKDGSCVTLAVEAPWLRLHYGFISRRGRSVSPAAKAFMAIVRGIEKEIAA